MNFSFQYHFIPLPGSALSTQFKSLSHKLAVSTHFKTFAELFLPPVKNHVEAYDANAQPLERCIE